MQQGKERSSHNAGKDLQLAAASSCACHALMQPKPSQVLSSEYDVSRAVWRIPVRLDVQITVMSRQQTKASLLNSFLSLVTYTMLSLTGSSLVASLSSRV